MIRVVAAACLAALLAACTTAPAPTAPGDPPPAPRPQAEPDPERRVQVRLELAGAYFGRGQFDTAMNEVRQVLALRPDMPEALSLQALIQSGMGDVRGAEATFRRALQVAPTNGDTMHNYGWFLCQQRRFDEADAQFQAAIAAPLYRESARTLLVAGVCQARAGRNDRAEQLLSRSFELDPSNPSTAYNLSDLLYRRGEYERVRFMLRRVNAQPETSNSLSLWLAAKTENKLNNPAGVQEIGRQLRERFPQAPELQLLERNRFDE